MSRLLPVVGTALILGLAFSASTNREAVRLKTVLWGLGLQLALALSCLTNMAAGVGGGKLDHAEVLATGECAQHALIEVLGRIVQEVATLA
jgi:nucleoside permease NupC